MKYLILIVAMGVISCSQGKKLNSVAYTVNSDSTIYYYKLGWRQIMDEGNYGPAESSYRKALFFDPDFLVGKAVLARLTTNLEERLQLYGQLDAQKEKVNGSERLILDVYIALVNFTNIREQSPESAGEALETALNLMEVHLRKIVEVYPEETYLKAEYIEALHSIYGSEPTLLAMDTLLSETQKRNPFLVGYKASIMAEIGQYDQALDLAKELSTLSDSTLLPKTSVVFADIYFKMDSIKMAKKYADAAVNLDPRNLDASRLQSKINSLITNQLR